MRIQDLTREELELLNTNFDPELEKNAEAYVQEEMSKVAELEKVAEDCYNYGAELAMQKIAAMESAHQEKVAMEEKEEVAKGLEKKMSKETEKKEEESEEEKTASAMGNFSMEGYWNTLMEKGAEYYGDENIYLEELCKEAGVGEFAKNIAEKAKRYAGEARNMAGNAYKSAKGSAGKARNMAGNAYKSAKGSAGKAGEHVKNYNNGMKEDFRQAKKGLFHDKDKANFSRFHGFKSLGKGLAKATPYAAAVGGAGYGGKKAYDKLKK